MAVFLALAGAAGLRADEDVSRPLAALKALKIQQGDVVEVFREGAPAPVTSNGTSAIQPSAHTVVKLLLTPAKGSHIHVEIWLPDPGRWNSKLLGLGNSGAAGHIVSAKLAGPASDGYAVATTDLGTAPDPDSGVGNPEVWKDFGFRATHLMTVVAKQVIAAYYGHAPTYTYFVGGSTGGQQALQEAQRFPEDYDGIVASIPAHCRTPLHAYFLWNDQILTQCPFTPSQEKNVRMAGVEYMASRESPLLAGQMISDPRHGAKDIEAVIALALHKDPTLTPQHAEALQKLFDGPRNSETGERIFDGIPFGASLETARGGLYLFKWVFGPSKSLGEINFAKDIDTYTAALGPYLNADNPDLAAFSSCGGKLLMISGAEDSTVPYTATLDYYDRVIERFGSLGKVQAFFRYYIMPGMSHGTGPLNRMPKWLNLLVQWREKGSAPDLLHAQRVENGTPNLDIPIYPYPSHAVWDEAHATFKREEGPTGGVDRVAERYLPEAAE